MKAIAVLFASRQRGVLPLSGAERMPAPPEQHERLGMPLPEGKRQP